ncbi:hypothetical protein [Laspinema olomoucense]|uniref:Uncharacterized protein n=1 Tax=Laspinema olomoucense D3b TaxID=2953688 RepID=A0ABT2N4V1_9CYAN|nr:MULTISPECIES: hypothetical protein [unclassified Laspinema]MCT7976415.1 hypothetical protein [Laspinema sp. D3b]MCT7991589.1 hypothetical protein [Laspinema sp. D3a]
MQISKRTLLIVGEAMATTAIGLIHEGLGVALTFGLALWHIRYDNTMPVQQDSMVQRVTHQVPIAPGMEEKNQDSEHEQ